MTDDLPKAAAGAAPGRTSAKARAARRESTRTRVLDIGTAVLLRHGYHGTGLNDVLRQAGIPKGSFYYHFASKEEFVAEAIDRYATTALGDITAFFSTAHSDARQQLHAFFTVLAARFADLDHAVGCLVGGLGAEISEESETCRAALRRALGSWSAAFSEVMRRGQEQGVIRADIPAADLADLTLHAWEGSLLRMKIERSERPLQQCLDVLVDMLLRP